VTWIIKFTLPKTLMFSSFSYPQKRAFRRYNFIHWPFNFVKNEWKTQNWLPVLSTSAFTWLSLDSWRYFNQLIHSTTNNDHKNISFTLMARETYFVILMQQLKTFYWMSMKPKGVLNYLSHEILTPNCTMQYLVPLKCIWVRSDNSGTLSHTK
jgi:hypothetical protein